MGTDGAEREEWAKLVVLGLVGFFVVLVAFPMGRLLQVCLLAAIVVWFLITSIVVKRGKSLCYPVIAWVLLFIIGAYGYVASGQKTERADSAPTEHGQTTQAPNLKPPEQRKNQVTEVQAKPKSSVPAIRPNVPPPGPRESKEREKDKSAFLAGPDLRVLVNDVDVVQPDRAKEPSFFWQGNLVRVDTTVANLGGASAHGGKLLFVLPFAGNTATFTPQPDEVGGPDINNNVLALYRLGTIPAGKQSQKITLVLEVAEHVQGIKLRIQRTTPERAITDWPHYIERPRRSAAPPPLRDPLPKQLEAVRILLGEMQARGHTEMWLSQLFFYMSRGGLNNIPPGGAVDYPEVLRQMAARREIEILETAQRDIEDYWREIFHEDIRFRILELKSD